MTEYNSNSPEILQESNISGDFYGTTPYQKIVNSELLGAMGPTDSAYWVNRPIDYTNFKPWSLAQQPLQIVGPGNLYGPGFETGDFPKTNGQYDASDGAMSKVMFPASPLYNFGSKNKKNTNKKNTNKKKNRKFGSCPCNGFLFSASKKKSSMAKKKVNKMKSGKQKLLKNKSNKNNFGDCGCNKNKNNLLAFPTYFGIKKRKNNFGNCPVCIG